jgi:hypothetical protein
VAAPNVRPKMNVQISAALTNAFGIRSMRQNKYHAPNIAVADPTMIHNSLHVYIFRRSLSHSRMLCSPMVTCQVSNVR